MATVLRPDVTTGRTRPPLRSELPKWIAAIGVPGAVLTLHTLLYGQWIEDDAGITFAYARSITQGLGPVVQMGAAPVEGWSNPTWLGLMLLGRLSGLFDHGTWFGLTDLVLFPKTVAVLCGLAMFAAMFWLARAVSPRPVLVTVLAGSVTALVPSFVIWSTSGLENSLFALLVVALSAVIVRAVVLDRLFNGRTAVLCGVLAAALALTRPDGLIYALAYPLVAVIARRSARSLPCWKAIGHAVAAFALLVGSYGTWRLVTFGDWLPNTARAKQQGFPGLGALNRPGELVAYGGWLAFAAIVLAVSVALRRRADGSTAVLVLLVPLGLAATAYIVLAPDWMAQYRFSSPIWPLVGLVGVLALEQTLEGQNWRRRRNVLVVAGTVALVSVVGFVQSAVTFRSDTTAPMCFVAQSVGQRVDSYADILQIRDGSLLAVDGGGTSLVGRMRFVDLSGLTDARIARAWQEGDAAGLRGYVLDEVRPTFIKSSRAWAGGASSGLLRDPRFERDYLLLFAPEAGSGTWVRRDAVADPARVRTVRDWAPQAYAAVEQRYLRPEAQTEWRCGATLTPGSPSPFPLPAAS